MAAARLTTGMVSALSYEDYTIYRPQQLFKNHSHWGANLSKALIIASPEPCMVAVVHLIHLQWRYSFAAKESVCCSLG